MIARPLRLAALALGVLSADAAAQAGPVAEPLASSAVPAPGAGALMDGLLGAAAGGGPLEFLPVERAFRLDVEVAGPERIEARWTIAPGYYLYRDRLRFTLAGSPGTRLADPRLPPGEPKDDDYFGRVAVVYDRLDAALPVLREREPAEAVSLTVTYQGCADAGLCYPPVAREFPLALPPAPPGAHARAVAYRPPSPPEPAVAPPAAPDLPDALPFEPVATVAGAERALAEAARAGRPAMLEFYADWCIPCRQMERTTFADPAVRAALDGTVLLRVDVTGNRDPDRALLARFGVEGPPAILFFGRDGAERSELRVHGYLGPAPFRDHLATVARRRG